MRFFKKDTPGQREQKKEKYTRKVERATRKALQRMPKKSPNGASKAMLRMMKLVGADQIRNDLLKPDAFPADIKEMLAEGKSVEEVLEYYWHFEKFRELWMKLGLNKDFLEGMIIDCSKN